MEMIKDFEVGQHVFNLLLVTQVVKCVTTQGRSYLNVTLQDSLLRLSAMTEEQQLKIVNKIIDDLKKKEKEDA